MTNTSNPLTDYFAQNRKNIIHKWWHYFDVCHQYFQRFRNKPCTILETGVWKGGACICMRALLAVFENPDKKVRLADSLEERIDWAGIFWRKVREVPPISTEAFQSAIRKLHAQT